MSFAPQPISAVVTPFVMGEHATTLLYAVLSLQTAQYYWQWRRDRAAYKWLVGTLWAMGTFQWVVSLAYAFKLGVAERSNPAPDTTLTVWWGTWSTEISKAVMLVPTQGFFAHRCFTLCRQSRALGLTLATIIIANLLFGVLSPILYQRAVVEQRFQDFFTFKFVTFLWPWTSVATDVLMSGILLTRLMPERGRWEGGLEKVVQNIIILSISTAGLTTAASLVLAIAEVTMGLVLTNIAIVHVVIMLQLIMPIAHLNLRHYLRRGGESTMGSEKKMQSSGLGFVTISSDSNLTRRPTETMETMSSSSLPPKRPPFSSSSSLTSVHGHAGGVGSSPASYAVQLPGAAPQWGNFSRSSPFDEPQPLPAVHVTGKPSQDSNV